MNKKNLLLYAILVGLLYVSVHADQEPAQNQTELEFTPELAPESTPAEPAPEKKSLSLFEQIPQETATPPAQTAPLVPAPTPAPVPVPMPAPAPAPAPLIQAAAQDIMPLETKPTTIIKTKQQKQNAKKLVNFDFDNEDLAKVINKFAELQSINIILPSGANAITQKVTFKLNKKIPLAQAERYFDTMLDIAGYSIVPHGDFYLVVKNDPQIAREQLPLYIEVPPQNLPEDGRIQVVYYLQNIKVPEPAQQNNDSLFLILNDVLSVNRAINFDVKSNAVIMSDKASNIKAAMTLLLELDSMGVRDVIQQIQLFHTSAVNVANILQSQILAVSGTAQGRIRAEVKSESGLYFAPGTRIVGDSRTNSLIIMGKEPAVERVMDFVRDYVDVPMETGNSILHYYELQYLDAEQFAEVLKKIVTAQGPSGQATTESAGGPSKTFEGVIIVPEKPVEEVIEKLKLAESNAAPGSQSILKGTVYRGGNRIIVAAKHRDWKRIEKLIKDLDKPQYQVIIQVMVVDVDAINDKFFGTQTRNPQFFQLPPGFSFQTTHLIAPPIPFSSANPNPLPGDTMATDLLALITGFVPSPASEAVLLTNPNSVQPSLPSVTGSPGSLIVSVNDTSGSGIWTFLQWLNAFTETRILSHPYLIARNNSKAEEIISTIKRIAGDASTGEGGILASKQQEIEAALKVSVVPRVSSKDRVNLQISVAINNFVGGSAASSATGNSVNTRELHTDVNMSSGQMLVLGGLTRSDVSETDNETPLLGRIPVIRWFFSSNKKSVERINVTLFIIPTIVEPKIRAGLNKFTKDKIDYSYTDIEEGDLFDQMRDPVTYLFFKGANLSADTLDEYLADAQGDFVRKGRVEKHRGPIREVNHSTTKTGGMQPRPEESASRNAPVNRESAKLAGGGSMPIKEEQLAEPVEPVEKNLITEDSQQLKKILTPEKNPLLQ